MQIKVFKMGEAVGLIRRFWNKYKYSFLITIIVGLIVYYQMYSSGVGYADPFPNMDRYYVNEWGLELGRWFLEPLDQIQSGMVSPFLDTLFSLILYGIANSLLAYMFRLENKYLQILLSTMIIAAPNVAISLNNYYMSEAYSFAYLFAILSVLFIHEHTGQKYHLPQPISIFCLVMALGFYQSYLGIAYVLMVIMIISDTFQHRLSAKDIKHIIITAVASPIIYFVMTKMIQAIANVQMASFRGAADISVGSILHSLPTTIQKSYTDFFAFYFQHTDLSQNSFRIIPINIALFITVLGVMLYLLFSDSRIKILYKVLICALIALIPIFANVIDIIASSTEMYLTSIGGMLILMPLGVSLVLRTIRFNPHVVAKSVIIILCLLLSYTNVLQINADTSVMIHNQNQAVSLANRIWTRIEEKYPEDLRNQTIAIMGIPSMNEEFSSSAMFYNNANWYARIGMFWNDWNGAAGSWTTLFRNDLGIMINYCNHDQFREIADNEAYQQMPVYPAEGCIQKINDIIVVKLVAEEAIAEWY